MHSFISSRILRGRGSRQFLSEDHYRIHRSPDDVTVSIPCHLVERLFAEGNSLIIMLRPSPEPSLAPFYRSGPRPRQPWSDEEEPPPTYQEVMDGRKKVILWILKYLVLWLQNPTERPSPRPSDNMWEVRRRQRTNIDRSRSAHNIFTSNRNSREVNNVQRGRGLLGLNNAPRGRVFLD